MELYLIIFYHNIKYYLCFMNIIKIINILNIINKNFKNKNILLLKLIYKNINKIMKLWMN